ncbi:MAG: GTPase RsgA [Clostridiales bacterium]|nr:GTPase RsgA [Clostridiales bacterium]
MDTEEIREDDSKGHHTTTYRQLFILENGAKIIDTPGMRELGMWVVDDGMEQSFSDVHELVQQCRFSDCTHTNEPGCTVKIALENGTLNHGRWENYLKLLKESKFQAAKERRNKAREAKTKGKNMAKYIKKVNSKKEER